LTVSIGAQSGAEARAHLQKVTGALTEEEIKAAMVKLLSAVKEPGVPLATNTAKIPSKHPQSRGKGGAEWWAKV